MSHDQQRGWGHLKAVSLHPLFTIALGEVFVAEEPRVAITLLRRLICA
ncbi:hypothetical protein ACTMTF_20640 [Nonomuraea sp. ZG12]